MEGEYAAVATTDYRVLVYSVYGFLSLALTIWLARTLAQNGRVFLDEVFKNNGELAGSVNRLLVVGFYLVNLGYACLLLRSGAVLDVREAIEDLASKMGALLLSLAVMHFMNMFVFHRIRRRAQRSSSLPVAPHGVLAPAPEVVFAAPVAQG